MLLNMEIELILFK